MTRTNFAHPQQHGCTGLSAFWCPNHGDCSCPRDPETGLSGELDANDCDLHGNDLHLPLLMSSPSSGTDA